MPNPNHLAILLQGVPAWNAWRGQNPAELPDLAEASLRDLDLQAADLHRANLSGADLHHANLSHANLSEARLRDTNLYMATLDGAELRRADLKRVTLCKASLQQAGLINAHAHKANFSQANVREANFGDANLEDAEFSGGVNMQGCNLRHAFLKKARLMQANLGGAQLQHARLPNADLSGASLVNANCDDASFVEADLQGVDFTGASLCRADLSKASLVRTSLENVVMNGARVYGCSVWDLRGEPRAQNDLLISPRGHGDITTDQLEVAQFIYLMYNNKKIRSVIDSVTSKGVLILGRFSLPERKAVLDGLRDSLRTYNLLPIVFDFERPTDKDYTETVLTLAGMSLFVIADVTAAKSTPLELEAIAKQFKLPILPIIDTSADPHPFSMLVDLVNAYHWVLQPLEYTSKDQLLQHVKTHVIDRAVDKHNALRAQKAQSLQPLTLPPAQP